jgi:hypothetical protein
MREYLPGPLIGQHEPVAVLLLETQVLDLIAANLDEALNRLDQQGMFPLLALKMHTPWLDLIHGGMLHAAQGSGGQ